MTDQNTPDSLINYDEIVQDSLRGVIPRVLGDVACQGKAPGAHHFYITFKTKAPGVQIASHLVARYPDDMTIVLQNQFWDLKVEQEWFEVGLSFSQKPETLHIPYTAVTAFVDPHVNFGLQFPTLDMVEAANNEDAAPPAPEKPQDASAGEKEAKEEGSNIVTLDKFRKK